MYKINITLTDQDYLDFNNFWTFKSEVGKKQIINLRLLVCLFFLVISFLTFALTSFSSDSLIYIVLYIIALILLQIFFKKIIKDSIKKQVKNINKNGKAYSPNSTLEFYDEYFTETTKDEKTEQKYTSIEQITLIKNKVIYIHKNNIMAYIIPLSSFNSEDELNSFMQFLETKCASINTYEE